ncbi:membrane protein [Mycobacterium phage Aegeus]|nr:membrane protein [Mycobacterium phage Baudelaire]WKW86627.1 membrane protein [Mycobacterium phage Aegeus]
MRGVWVFAGKHAGYGHGYTYVAVSCVHVWALLTDCRCMRRSMRVYVLGPAVAACMYAQVIGLSVKAYL